MCVCHSNTHRTYLYVLRVSTYVCVLAAGSRDLNESSHGLRSAATHRNATRTSTRRQSYSIIIIMYNVLFCIYERVCLLLFVCVCVCARGITRRFSFSFFRTHQHSHRTVKTGRTCSDTAGRTRTRNVFIVLNASSFLYLLTGRRVPRPLFSRR